VHRLPFVEIKQQIITEYRPQTLTPLYPWQYSLGGHPTKGMLNGAAKQKAVIKIPRAIHMSMFE
jgi:hypothetical protein